MAKPLKPKICFVGVGNMGNPMAANLIRAGYQVEVFDLNKEKAQNLLDLGATWSDSLSNSVSRAKVIISSLPGPPQVSEVLLGSQGILESAKEGSIIIDTSTSSVELAEAIGVRSTERKLKFLEAPITNAVDGARLGKLAFFIGGNKEVFEEQRDIFEVLGEDLFYVGKPGNGATTKLLTNLLWFINAAAIGEGLMLGAKADIPLETVWAAIKSSAGNSWVVEHDVPSIFEGHYDPSFSLALCCKDLGLVHGIAKKQGFELTMGGVAEELFQKAREKYGDDAPELSVVKLIEEKMDVLLRPTKDEIKPKELSQSELMSEAHEHMPQGVAENYRYWGDDKTIFVKNSKGSKITDANGKVYTDFRLGYGPIILGYADERVDSAVIKQISSGGTLTGFSTGLDTEVVKQIKEMCPNIQKMRFANSGTEAVMGAVRTARAYTKRDRIVVIEGGFHGLYDEMMWKSSMEDWDPKSNQAPRVIPFGDGIPENTKELIDLLPLNNFEELESLFKEKGEQIACVVLEPIIGNCGSMSSSQEWLQTLKKTCEKNGALLIMDEVKTGFRVAKGGAQELYGIQADLTTYAKAMGNGYPIAAFGGRSDVMDVIGSHQGGVVHGGTYTANLIGLSAAKATLEILNNTNALESINQIGASLQGILGSVFTDSGIEHSFAGPNSMFGVHFSKSLPTNYRDWKLTNSSLYEKFAWNLIDKGVMLEPDSREPWFICEAHREMDLGWFEEVARASMRKAKK